MTTYHGGKKRIGREIAGSILEIYYNMSSRKKSRLQGYCEPFVGMCGVMSHVYPLLSEEDPSLSFLAGDTNGSVIKMWKKASGRKIWSPPRKCSKKCFETLKNDRKESAEKGFIGHVWAYRSKYFVSYFSNAGKGRIEKNRIDVIRIGDTLRKRRGRPGVKFSKGPYTQFSDLRGYIIYCDPPYQSSHQYYTDDRRQLTFDHDQFWRWCRRMSRHNTVLVSEYEAPRDFEEVWRQKGKRKLVEKLYLV